MSEINKELVRKTINAVNNNVKHWNQEEFYSNNECGTCYCFAGFAYLIHNKVSFDEGFSHDYGINEEMANSWEFDSIIQDQAFKALNLKYSIGLILFNPDNNLQDLNHYCDIILHPEKHFEQAWLGSKSIPELLLLLESLDTEDSKKINQVLIEIINRKQVYSLSYLIEQNWLESRPDLIKKVMSLNNYHLNKAIQEKPWSQVISN